MPQTGRELIDSLVCQRDNPSCMMNTYTKYSCIQFAIDAEKQDEKCSLKLRKWMESEGCLVQVEVLISVKDAVEYKTK